MPKDQIVLQIPGQKTLKSVAFQLLLCFGITYFLFRVAAPKAHWTGFFFVSCPLVFCNTLYY